ncbi:hypothetical protein BV22DRAFT_1052175 [Leucogyrophana mollusca]|uniref:Uncharacterized protein n=1 Tax=Leucogyrophana mollusca TaxID=85980 RepID=A0ACB8AYZ1_9AGAM|nr:hypothetical protein BV22DRAFT_1052175 [Leucogyrophana mollusca]
MSLVAPPSLGSSEDGPRRPPFIPQLPAELWMMCLSYLRRQDIHQLLSVSRLFHQLCLEPLFEQLVMLGPSPEELTKSSVPSHLLQLESAVTSLKSLATDPTSITARHAVRRWWFRGMRKTSRTSRIDTRVFEACELLANAFTSSLSSFIGLSVLNLSFVIVQDELVETLAQLPLLQTLGLDNCEIVCAKKIQLPMVTLSITQTFRFADPKPTGEPITILSPTRLERLTLDDNRWTPAVVSSLLFLGTFHRLTYLAILVTRDQSAAFFEFLRQCPHLLSLSFARHTHIVNLPACLPADTVPLLTSYDGPLYLAKIFASNRHIQNARIDLANIDGARYTVGYLPMFEVVSGLSEFFEVAPGLQSLKICGSPPGLHVLRTIASCLRELRFLDVSLRYLDLRLDDSVPPTPHFFSATERDTALRISSTTGVEVDCWTGFPKHLPTSSQGIMCWTILGRVTLPPRIEVFHVRSPHAQVLESVDSQGMLSHLLIAYPRLRRLGVGHRVWVRQNGRLRRWDEYNEGLSQGEELVNSVFL